MNPETPIFSYGSLVNPHARPATVASWPAVLPGWVREWMHCVETPHGKVCALTASPDPAVELHGLLLAFTPAAADELARREIGYAQQAEVVRLKVPGADGGLRGCQIFTSPPSVHRTGSIEYPIWRSYLDFVLAGYWAMGGGEAVEDFIRTTRGWETPILDDRDRARYPRVAAPDPAVKSRIGEILARSGVLGPRLS
jgi:hypothetical protein